MTTEFESASQGDDVPEYYADSLNMTFGPYGFGLEFGLIPFPDFTAGTGTAATSVPARPLVRVRVSPQLAQAIKILFDNNMSVYESIFGEVKVPDDTGKILDMKAEGDQA